MKTAERLEQNHAELLRLGEEARKAREAAMVAQKVADEKADEFSRYAKWCLAVSEQDAEARR